MCSSACQGCQEVVESRFLRLKLGFTEPYNGETNTTIMGGWSFLHTLSDAKAPAVNQRVYVHPLLNRSGSRLSDESLEMCTEQLGSETGSEGSLLSLETQTVACDINPSKPRESSSTRKIRRGFSFPPPLTSISGSNGVQIKPHRENGRLIIQAVSFPTCHSYFHAERSEGRFRLSLFKDTTTILGIEDNSEEQEQENDVEVEEEEFSGETENREGNNGNVGDEIGAGKLPMPSSCKESNRGHKGGLLNWKPLLVTT
ncbi:Mitochondrial Rho GTPase [Hibiscus syriacus]|uniref:Mitochondrial Rho GTPase n=1 Tax=Hibiscus syriacus TaxID=106335 RepID=A0A6A2XKX4_HIBSY|nr:protein FANTASTIC FOUR 2-like [Hibiscus syriacus]XP_039061820.1 protein FANTASTIC FOUR 2-like [Hibiscus syriacus]KAE8676188.1 Mitochondrial Rho GTPase [Hibiscus syriacus]KAE8722885.1 Mitochondrial Rho GTPase [Hibiscus syriacus]